MLAGTVGYVLLRCLAGYLRLGLPAYDWQWYLALALFMSGLLLHLGLGLRHTRLSRALYLLLIVWLIAGFHGFGFSERLSVASQPPVALSFWAYTDFRAVPEAVLQDLGSIHATLYIDSPTVTFDGEGGQQLAEGLRRLARYGVGVVLVPVPGDFLSAPVAREWVKEVKLAAEFVRRERLTNVRGILGDAEGPMKAPPVADAVKRQEVARATQELGLLIAELHRDYLGLQLGVTAGWPLYLDGMDGDADLAVLSRSPVDPPGGWDIVNVMTYSSLVAEGQGPYWVYSVEAAARRRYPTRDVSHLIGIVGSGFPWEPLLSFDELVRDAHISRALGVREVVVFQLNGALKVFGDDFVAKLERAVNSPRPEETVVIPFSRLISLEHYRWILLDVVSSISRGALIALAIWSLLSGVVLYRGYAGGATSV